MNASEAQHRQTSMALAISRWAESDARCRHGRGHQLKISLVLGCAADSTVRTGRECPHISSRPGAAAVVISHAALGRWVSCTARSDVCDGHASRVGMAVH